MSSHSPCLKRVCKQSAASAHCCESEASCHGGDASARLRARSDVDYIIHCAASIRFDLPVKAVLRANFLPTRALLDLAAALPRLRAFTFMSTAFANAHLPQARARSAQFQAPCTEVRALLS